MISRDQIVEKVKAFKIKHGVADDQDEHVVATLHLAAEHQLDVPMAQDRTSRGANDHGIDAWHLDQGNWTLYIYQSKLSNSKALVGGGFTDLAKAADWLGEVLTTDDIGSNPSNPCIYNLVQTLAKQKDQVRHLCFRLISPFDPNELDGVPERAEATLRLASSSLNKYAGQKDIRVKLEAKEFNLEEGVIPRGVTSYPLPYAQGQLIHAQGATLQLLTISLNGPVELFRKRGNNLFEKNVRLYLGTKEARFRLENPMVATLEEICSGGLEPTIFPFYHTGVTLTARTSDTQGTDLLSLEHPYVINGCQTINIADHYLRGLEKAKSKDKIERFKQIWVVAKIVTAASDEQLREIANCNNRQNPIESWQLFSNDPIHIEIEAALREAGVFYERQKGKFDSLMRSLQTHAQYPNTNGTYVTVEGLGQIICLCRGRFPLAAKRADIFVSKASHDAVFDGSIPNHVNDIIWAWNAHRAVRRGLANYLQLPAHSNDQTERIFRKPAVVQIVHHAALRHLYQRCEDLSVDFIWRLNKIAPPRLVQEAEAFYKQVVLKTKTWYVKESQNLTVEVAGRTLESFLAVLCTEVGLRTGGAMPFTEKPRVWPELEPPGDEESA